MLSLEDLLNSWGLWKSTGEILFKAGGLSLQERTKTSNYGPRILCRSDKPQKLIDTLINRHLTKRQRDVINIEYRALRSIPHFKNCEERAHYLQLTGKAYRQRLSRAKSALNANLVNIS